MGKKNRFRRHISANKMLAIFREWLKKLMQESALYAERANRKSVLSRDVLQARKRRDAIF